MGVPPCQDWMRVLPQSGLDRGNPPLSGLDRVLQLQDWMGVLPLRTGWGTRSRGRAIEQVLVTRWAVCPLRSCRTFLLLPTYEVQGKVLFSQVSVCSHFREGVPPSGQPGGGGESPIGTGLGYSPIGTGWGYPPPPSGLDGGTPC